jgi:hypothetical protein
MASSLGHDRPGHRTDLTTPALNTFGFPFPFPIDRSAYTAFFLAPKSHTLLASHSGGSERHLRRRSYPPSP